MRGHPTPIHSSQAQAELKRLRLSTHHGVLKVGCAPHHGRQSFKLWFLFGRYPSEKNRNLLICMGALASLIDLETPGTWPEAVVDFTENWAEQLRGSTEFTSDLRVPIEREGDLRGALADGKLLAFHATRLLEHEVADIKSGGLRRLTPDLVYDRISAAYERGLLTDEERNQCLSQNVFAIENAEGRENQICSVIGRGIFDHEIGLGLHPLLGGWGGEAMNGWPGPDENPLLRRLGRPAIVVFAIDIASAGPTIYAPGLAKKFVGRRLGLTDAFGEIYVREDIPGENVIAIWQPGNPEYDGHHDLPRN